jgi:uncharacterized membrane protein
MTTNRLEAFSDGVFAIIITVMLTFESLSQIRPEMGTYVLSYIMLGIYWNNHHHLLQAARHISGNVPWANLHLLFWASLMPLAAKWVRDSGFVGAPVLAFGVDLLMAAVSYTILTVALVNVQGGDNSRIAAAIGNDVKGKGSILLYIIAIAVAIWAPYVSCSLYVLVAIIWFVPDRRMADHLTREHQVEG